jgi:hypothetical protein
MSVTVTKDGPYFSSGSISFSSLRNTFVETTSGSISASTLRRNTDVNETNPIVPDSTENEQISSGSNLSLSQFRNSIKRYSATQSGTDTNASYPTEPGFRMGRYDPNGRGIDWCGGGYYGRDGQGGGVTGNLAKNVQKFVYITGVCGSYYVDSAAAQLAPDPNVYNVTINVSGEIYGAGGDGGDATSISGKHGGDALNVYTNIGGNINIIVESSAKIYGGGGGGELGSTGAPGTSGVCYSTYQSTSCNSGDTASYAYSYTYYTYTSYSWRFCCKTDSHPHYATIDTYNCSHANSVPGAPGGTGGSGGHGQGYTTARTNGSSGNPGTSGGCPNYGGTGNTGETGGDGGDWGQSGGDTTNSGSGGAAGKAINGNKHNISGSINSNTVKGIYQ